MTHDRGPRGPVHSNDADDTFTRSRARDSAAIRLAPPARDAYMPPPPRPLACTATLIAILDAPAQPGETIDACFRRKEAELRIAFAALCVTDAHALHARLAGTSSAAMAADPIASRFSRMIVPRRQRLLAFLADARRRAANAVACDGDVKEAM